MLFKILTLLCLVAINEVSNVVIEGTVRDIETGDTLTIAYIEVKQSPSSSWESWIKTDNEGRFKKELAEGTYMWRATRDGYTPKEFEVTITDTPDQSPMKIDVEIYPSDIA